MSSLILTNVLAWAWEHEDELPRNPTQLLKRLTWMCAQRMYDAATSGCHDLITELHARCGGDRGKLVLNLCATGMMRAHPCPKQGGYLAAVHHLENNEQTVSIKCTYE